MAERFQNNSLEFRIVADEHRPGGGTGKPLLVPRLSEAGVVAELATETHRAAIESLASGRSWSYPLRCVAGRSAR